MRFTTHAPAHAPGEFHERLVDGLDLLVAAYDNCMLTQMCMCMTPSRRTTRQRATPAELAFEPRLFRALCDPTRLALLSCLARCCRPCSVTEIAQCCKVDYSVVSRHLALLHDAGVLESHKDGRTVFYQVRFDALAGRLRSLADAIDACCPGNRCSGSCCGVCCQPHRESGR